MRPIFRAALLGLGLTSLGCANTDRASDDFTETSRFFACARDGERPIEDWKGNWGEIGEWCHPEALEAAGLAEDVAQTIEARYPGLIIEQRKGPWSQRKPIIAKLVKTITVSAHIAADARGVRDGWSKQDAHDFVLGALSTIYQQSFFGQYKRVDGQLMLMRGGDGHHHGMMQLDDQWHHDTVYGETAGWDLLHNLEFGLGLYLDAYAEAEGAPCVTDAKSRARAAYSVFLTSQRDNVCRWRDNPSSADNWFVKRWDELTTPGKLEAYDWVLDYEDALAALDDIDFIDILDLPNFLPGPLDGPRNEPEPAVCSEEGEDAPNTEAGALNLGDDFTDCDDGGPTEVISGKITSNEDIDWFVYTADDTNGCDTNPTIVTEAVPGLMVCQYFECVHDNASSTEPQFECPHGSFNDVSGDGRLGCCSNTGGFAIDSVNCLGTWHENLSVHVRVQSSADEVEDFCAEYSFQVHQ